jgi:hypothetical protein
MAYEKPFLSVSNHAVGLQCVNRALENNRALYSDQFDPNHSPGLGGGSVGDPFLAPGRHDDPLIARTVADFAYDATYGYVITLVSGPMIFSGAQRLAAGRYEVRVTTPRLFYAFAAIKGPSTGNPRTATCLVTSTNNGPKVTVSTWNVAGGVIADCDFSLVLFAEGVA